MKVAALEHLRMVMNVYHPISDGCWADLRRSLCEMTLVRHQYFVRMGDHPHFFGFVHRGLLRMYTCSLDGTEYTKIFFSEGMMPGTMVALLTGEASVFSIQALEDCHLITIDHAGFRSCLQRHDDLIRYHARYMELNWILAKEPREVALVQKTADERYQDLLKEKGDLLRRIPQQHVASYLGVSPTHLSRIRRRLNQSSQGTRSGSAE